MAKKMPAHLRREYAGHNNFTYADTPLFSLICQAENDRDKSGFDARRQPSGEAALRLEIKDNKWKFEENERVVLSGSKCNCRTCPNCGRKRAYELRRVLLDKSNLEKFKRPVMFTLTADPKNFDSPEHAHEVVTKGGYIRRMLRLLGIDTWLWVLEFHKSGWPHWHIVADVTGRGKKPIDYDRVYHLWRDKWGLARILHISPNKSIKSAAHAMNYVTGYLTMPGKNPFPEWFLSGSRRRLCQASQKVGRLTERECKPSKSDPAKVKKRRESRALIVRMNECGTRSTVLLETVDPVTQQSSFRYIGMLETTPETLVLLSESGYLPPGISASRENLERWGYTTRGTVCLQFKRGDIKSCLESINRFLMSKRSDFRSAV